jgi:hypothetical protein
VESDLRLVVGQKVPTETRRICVTSRGKVLVASPSGDTHKFTGASFCKASGASDNSTPGRVCEPRPLLSTTPNCRQLGATLAGAPRRRRSCESVAVAPPLWPHYRPSHCHRSSAQAVRVNLGRLGLEPTVRATRHAAQVQTRLSLCDRPRSLRRHAVVSRAASAEPETLPQSPPPIGKALRPCPRTARASRIEFSAIRTHTAEHRPSGPSHALAEHGCLPAHGDIL